MGSRHSEGQGNARENPPKRDRGTPDSQTTPPSPIPKRICDGTVPMEPEVCAPPTPGKDATGPRGLVARLVDYWSTSRGQQPPQPANESHALENVQTVDTLDRGFTAEDIYEERQQYESTEIGQNPVDNNDRRQDYEADNPEGWAVQRGDLVHGGRAEVMESPRDLPGQMDPGIVGIQFGFAAEGQSLPEPPPYTEFDPGYENDGRNWTLWADKVEENFGDLLSE